MAFGLPSTSTDDFNTIKPSPSNPPSPRLVMITLCCVTLPIEVAFLATLRALGWLRVPFLFLASSLIFFCIAVSPCIRFHAFKYSLNCHIGCRLSLPCSASHQFPLEKELGSGYVRSTYTLCTRRPYRPALTGRLFRDRLPYGCTSQATRYLLMMSIFTLVLMIHRLWNSYIVHHLCHAVNYCILRSLPGLIQSLGAFAASFSFCRTRSTPAPSFFLSSRDKPGVVEEYPSSTGHDGY